jgi:gamma-glutamylcyclotransferase (GGCT)/AIG2-like uncharacterized protein YtfP
MQLYFAYGANMDRAHMTRTAPGAGFLGVASLPSHRVAIGRSGYGTLVPAPGGLVWGVLWSLTAADAAALDGFEGVAEGFYRRGTREVTDQTGAIRAAMVYLATDDRPGAAHPSYVEQVTAAARAAGLPEHYTSELARLPVGPATGDRWIPPAERGTRPKAPAR